MDRKFIGNGTPSEMLERTFWLGRTLDAPEAVVPAPRHSLRRQCQLEVVINHGLAYSVPSHVRDLSLTGAFVEMDATHLPEGSYVEVVLRYRYEDRPIENRLPATVLRVEEGGMALAFSRYDDETYTDLTNLLYAL